VLTVGLLLRATFGANEQGGGYRKPTIITKKIAQLICCLWLLWGNEGEIWHSTTHVGSTLLCQI